jgi:hypothetical protein
MLEVSSGVLFIIDFHGRRVGHFILVSGGMGKRQSTFTTAILGTGLAIVVV